MATPNLGITEISPSQSDKVTTINQAFTDLDNASNAVKSVTVTGDTSLSQSELAEGVFIDLGGTPGSAFTLSLPGNPRMFILNNGTGQTATIEVDPGDDGADGDTVTVDDGVAKLLFSDGTNVYEIAGASGANQIVDWKDSVRVASTANGTLASDFENGDTVDGVTLSTGDRILLKDQTTASENGVYTVNASGAPTRADDFDDDAEVTSGAAVFVEEGTSNGGSLYLLTTTGSITVGTTNLTFSELSGGGGGSGVDVEENGTGIVTGATTFDFTGAGVTVTDAGSGVAEINIPGGSGSGGGSSLPGPSFSSYNIEDDANFTDAGMGLDPANGLDGWTAFNISSGTVDITATTSSGVYDTSTRSGTLLYQYANNPTTEKGLYLNDMIAVGEQIIAKFLISNASNDTNNAARCLLGFNDRSDNFSLDENASNGLGVYWDGGDLFGTAVLDPTNGLVVGERHITSIPSGVIYLRAIRTSSGVYFYFSTDGQSWSPMDGVLSDAEADNCTHTWIILQANVDPTNDSDDVLPVSGLEWVRHISNTNLDPYTPTSGGGGGGVQFYPSFTKPSASDFGTVQKSSNASSATASVTDSSVRDAVTFKTSGLSGDSGVYTPLNAFDNTAATWEWTIAILPSFPNMDFSSMGMAFRASDDRIIAFVLNEGTGTNGGYTTGILSSTALGDTFDSSTATLIEDDIASNRIIGPVIYMRAEFDGTYYYHSVSFDGEHFHRVTRLEESGWEINSGAAPTDIGLFIKPNLTDRNGNINSSADDTLAMHVFHSVYTDT